MNAGNRGCGFRRMGRRDALKTIIASAAAPAFVPARVLGAEAPSRRVALGCIGMGGQGTQNNLNSFLNEGDAQVVAVCDVFDARRDAAVQMVNKRYGTAGCRGYTDFREILARDDVDAVVISTPDHWHVPMSLMALEAGKDVFCEKPTLSIAEGHALIDAVKKRNAVFQIGLEDRSVIYYHKMIEWIRNGAIGDVRKIDVTLPEGYVHKKEEPAPVPRGLDYNLWVGPAPFRPYTPSRTVQKVWRMIHDYANGSLVDWGSHLVDTAQLAADAPDVCPVEVEGTGDIPPDSLTDVPVAYDVRYRYSNGVEMRVMAGKYSAAKSASIRFEGEKGWIGNEGWRGRLQASDTKILQTRYTPETSKHWPMPPSEHRNFLDCFKSRKPTTYTAETMHLLHTTLHLGVIAIRLGRKLRWDPKAEQFPNDDAANALRSRPPAREEWKKE